MTDRGSRKATIVCTTINRLHFLPAFVDNILRYGRELDTSVVIVGDRKTPDVCKEEARVQRQRGVAVDYMTIPDQQAYMERFPDLDREIPYDSDNRRNIGFLKALEEGADVVISIDDDNLCVDAGDFVGEHLSCGRTQTHAAALGAGSWFNVCSLLDAKPCSELLYPRGFPYRQRQRGTDHVEGFISKHIAANVGLWTSDPDVDAVGRLYAAPKVSSRTGGPVILSPGVRTPINTQNTAITRDAMAAYYYVRMGSPLRGMMIDRYGDIFSGYFLQWCVAAIGEGVRVGGPMLDQQRNPHNLFVDLWHELAGMMILEDVGPLLAEPPPEMVSYRVAYVALSQHLESIADRFEGFIWTDECRTYFRDISRIMRIWTDVYAAVTG
jgi:Reversibly glycosylated polypeptide